MTRRRRWAALAAVALLALGAAVMRRPTPNIVVNSLTVSGVPVAASLDPQTGRVVVVTRATRIAPGAILVLDAATGRLVRGDAGQGDAVAIDVRTGYAFAALSDGNGNGTVRSISMQSGIVLRTTALTITTVPVPMAVAERAGRVFIGNGAPHCCSPGTVSVVDARSGRLLRTVAVGLGPMAIVADERTGRVFVANLAGVHSYTGTVSVLDARSGTVLRTVSVGANPSAVTVDIRSRRVFVVNTPAPIAAGTVSVLDACTGALVRTTRVGIYPAAVAVDARSKRVFVANVGMLDNQGYYKSGGSISILDSAAGRLLGTVALSGSPSALAVDERRGRVYVAMGIGPYRAPPTGEIGILDARRGTLLRTIPLPATANALLVDERSGRLVTLGGGGMTRATDPWGWIPAGLRRRLPFIPPPGPTMHSIPGTVSVLDVTRS